MEHHKRAEKCISDVFEGIPGYRIRSIVAEGRCLLEVDLAKLHQDNEANWEYDPATFPAARLQVNGDKVRLTVFSTGRFLVTGASTEHEIRRCLRVSMPMVELAYIV